MTSRWRPPSFLCHSLACVVTFCFMHQAYTPGIYCVWGPCMPWLSGSDHGALCLQQAVILGVLSFFMAWVVQAFFTSVLLDIVNAGIPAVYTAIHCIPPSAYNHNGFAMFASVMLLSCLL